MVPLRLNLAGGIALHCRTLSVWLLVWGAALRLFAAPETTNSLLTSWLDAQADVQSWSADFVQTRTLKTLVQPLTSSGHVWFAAPSRFRWELGHPPQTIALRSSNELFVIYPRLKRAERYPLSGNQTGRWREMLALLDAGFPRSQAEVTSRYNVLHLSSSNGSAAVALEPKSSAARQMMPQIQIGFSITNHSLAFTELRFADGSTLRNDFTNPVLNPYIEPSLFEPNLAGDYKIVEPLKGGQR